MVRLRKGIKYVLRILFVFLVLNLIIAILKEYIVVWLRGRELSILEEFVRFSSSYWWALAIILGGIVAVWVYDWRIEKQDKFRSMWEFFKSTKELTPEDFKIQKYREAHLRRKSDATIESLLKEGKHVLISGKPKIGKTRSAYEALRKLEGFSVIKPRPEEIEVERISIPPLTKKNFIIFLDDLQHFAGRDVENLISKLKKEATKLVVLATCRTGEESNLVREEMLPTYREFTIVEMEEISKDDCQKLEEAIKNEDKEFEWKRDQFDGTPGCVTLDLEDMKERYRRAGDGKAILKAMKLMKEGNLYLFKEKRLQDVCEDIFELPTARYIWDEMINTMKENGFITTREGIVDIYDSYLDVCVYDYDASLNDLMKLKDILIRMSDSGSLLYLGNGFLYKEDFGRAKDCYKEALQIYPKYAAAHNCLGYVLTGLGMTEEARGRLDEAEKLYREAEKENRATIELSTLYAGNHNNLGFALTRLGTILEIKGRHREAASLYEEAEKEHREAIKLKPEYASAHRNLAYVLNTLKKYAEAENEFRHAIRMDPESSSTHNLFGYLLAKLERDGEAEKEYREAIRIKSDFPSARNNLGHLLTKLGRWEEAEKEFQEAIRADPDYVLAHLNLGHLLGDWERYEEAVSEYRKALDINPKYAEARNALGYILVKLGKYDDAEKEFGKAIELRPNYGDARRNLGYLLVVLGKDESKKGNWDKAESHYRAAEIEYRKALEICPNDEDTLICLGILLEKSNRDDEAEYYYKKAIEKTPSNVKAHTTYGYFLSYRKREGEAMREFKEVARMDPDNAQARSQLGYLTKELPNIYANEARALIESGHPEEAESKLMDALKLESDNAFAHKTLGLLKETSGDKATDELDKSRLYEEAIRAYRKALDLKPGYPSARRHLANSLAKLGRYDEAEEEYKAGKTVRNYPNNNFDFGIFLLKIGRKKEAAEELRIAAKLFWEQGKEEDAKRAEELLKTPEN